MNDINSSVLAVHDFTTDDFDGATMPFSAVDYSHLKFGCDDTARRFGYELADRFFRHHVDILIAEPTVVIPSPYNFVRNAATIMTEHFVNRLNEHLVNANGEHVDFSTIHRKVSYTSDYGFMSKEQRRGLLDNDMFFLNDGFYRGKTLIFIDDIRITGTHEDRLRDILLGDPHLSSNRVFFLYYAQMVGPCRADVEAGLNFSGIKSLDEYAELAARPNHHVIVRPIKFLLSRPKDEFDRFVATISTQKARQIYSGCLGEGYYKVPEYQCNFLKLKALVST